MIEKPYPTLGAERFAALKAKVEMLRANREMEGWVPPYTDEDMKVMPFDLEALREEVRLSKLERATAK